ncbi:MAG TPA: hypothetical protein VF092_03915 [Longimicrobium sp.]
MEVIVYPTLDELTEGGQLVVDEATDWEVGRWWAKASEFRRASDLLQEDPDNAFLLGYIAAVQAATAIVRAGGYRAVGRTLHHNTFAGAVALSGGRLSKAGRMLDRLGPVFGSVDRGEPNVSRRDLELLRAASDSLFREVGRD